jgi:dethiobiotin synthetase
MSPVPKLRGCFIAGTDTGVGKTRIAVALLGALAGAGVRALGMKAIASGTDRAGVNEDVARIHERNLTCLPGAAAAAAQWLAAENPYCFEWPVSPHLAAARAGVVIDPARIQAAARTLAAHATLLVVEGTGGWLAPIGLGRTMADVAEALALPVVLVVGLRLGCLSHALLTARAIASGPLPLVGWIGSHLDPGMDAAAENVATLQAMLSAPCLGLLPHAQDPAGDPAHLEVAARLLQHPISP